MATATKVAKDRIFECEVKRRRLKQGGGYEPFWKAKSVAEALSDNDTEFRCKDCHGEVRVLGKTSRVGAPAYVEHKLSSDAAFCPSSPTFLSAEDGRASRPSDRPVV